MLDGSQLAKLVIKRAGESWTGVGTDKHFVRGWSLAVEEQLALSLKIDRDGFLEHAATLPALLRHHLEALRRLRGEPLELSPETVRLLADGYLRPQTGLWKSELHEWQLSAATPLGTPLREALLAGLEHPPPAVPWEVTEHVLPGLSSSEEKVSLLLRMADQQPRSRCWRAMRRLDEVDALLGRALGGPHAASAAYFLAQLHLERASGDGLPRRLLPHLEGFVQNSELDHELDVRLFSVLPPAHARRVLRSADGKNRALLRELGLSPEPARPSGVVPPVLVYSHPELGELSWDPDREAFARSVESSASGAVEEMKLCLVTGETPTPGQAALATRIVGGLVAERWPELLSSVEKDPDFADRWEFESRRESTEILVYDATRWSIEIYVAPVDEDEADRYDAMPLRFDFHEPTAR
ncbi:MAG: hypothetical protein RLP09_03340 [Sandaracinaceae bacterium]